MKCRCHTCTGKVLLAMPVYNEEKYLDTILDAVGRYITDIVVIDDGSTDGTRGVLARRTDICVVSHPVNRGYGQAIIDAFHFGLGCGFEWLLTMDCDWQHDPALIPQFLAAIDRDDADVISGSRYLAESPRDDCPPSDRRQINRIITAILNTALGLQLTDSFCGFKAHRLTAMEELDLSEPGYALPLEFWVQAAYHQLRVRELPVSLIYNDPNRYFGGILDEADKRLAHYRTVLERSLAAVGWQGKLPPDVWTNRTAGPTNVTS